MAFREANVVSAEGKHGELSFQVRHVPWAPSKGSGLSPPSSASYSSAYGAAQPPTKTRLNFCSRRLGWSKPTRIKALIQEDLGGLNFLKWPEKPKPEILH